MHSFTQELSADLDLLPVISQQTAIFPDKNNSPPICLRNKRKLIVGTARKSLCSRMSEGSSAVVVVLALFSAFIAFFPLCCLWDLIWQQCKALWKKNNPKRNISGFVDYSPPAKSAQAPSEAITSPQVASNSGNLEGIPAEADLAGVIAGAETKSASNDQLNRAEDCVVLDLEPKEKKALNKDIFIKVLPVVEPV
ncbi:uncharacterized protein [Macrobrachium rosenbergii]|uniref:uncharacterized protein n=1 Tax=Macrobrachium rosenbergii TaxID=79674 RepID=UPI0034D64760